MKPILLWACALLLGGCTQKSATPPETKDSGSTAGEVPDRPQLPDKIPSDVPAYPGARLVGTFTAPPAQQYEFSTADGGAKVLSYYRQKLKEPGTKVALDTKTSDGGMLVVEDDANARTINIIVEKGTDGTAIRVTLRKKE